MKNKIINKIKTIKIDTRIMIKLALLVCLLCTFKYVDMNSKINNQKETIKELNKKLNSNKIKIEELEETNNQLVQQLESKWIAEKLQKETPNKSEVALCGLDNGNFAYESGDIAWDKTTIQYQLSLIASFNEEGHYMIEDYYCVALGSYYGAIGTKYIITLSNGATFKAIKFDEKSDKDVINSCYHASDGSMLEFVLNIPQAFSYYGGEKYIAINLHNKWSGSIIKMEVVKD